MPSNNMSQLWAVKEQISKLDRRKGKDLAEIYYRKAE